MLSMVIEEQQKHNRSFLPMQHTNSSTMIDHNGEEHNQYDIPPTNQLSLEQPKLSQSNPPYVRMLTSSWAVASSAVKDINEMQDVLAQSETSSGIADMKGGTSTDSSTGPITVRSEDTTYTSTTLTNMSHDDEDGLIELDDEGSLSIHSMSSVSVRVYMSLVHQ